MKIAIFDHLVTSTNAIGKCHLDILSHLAEDHEFTVFAVDFDNPRPDRIKFVRVPTIRLVLLTMMISYHIMSPLMLLWHRLRTGQRFDYVQGIGGNFLGADIAYSHFCHRVYLREHAASRPKAPVKRAYSFVYDQIVSWLEPFSYARARHIVTPSQGLAKELMRNFAGATEDKIRVIANPVDLSRMQRPDHFDVAQKRAELGFNADDIVMIFVAAGHFERKGLPLLLEAMAQVGAPNLKLLIVGGREYMIGDYADRVTKHHLQERVTFTGFQDDIRPFLWASDMFVFPSAYETFSMVSYEAAAAGLPVIASQLYGVEEFLKDGYNGWIVDRTAASLADKFSFVLKNPDVLTEMGQNAIDSVQRYGMNFFVERWRAYYSSLSAGELLGDNQIQNITPKVRNQ